ncbi:hypothetical protein Mucpa_6304 [Mucilaginibacter paludis DSM 18603]|uniref:Uncharacterized protein n=2 Tax=Mucilaginibacter TaxID=423349 RepID=H1Y5T8_9SPHI|nr:hypothetical protein Mucpa_6304 [Mucilaginibacter paludis DSM 18603]
MTCCHFATAQEIKIQPLKKVYHINHETAYCNVRNQSSLYNIYYRVGLEITKKELPIGETDDVYKLLPTKEIKITKFTKLKPKQMIGGRIEAECIGKESLYGISQIIRNGNLNDYDFRFKVVYGKDTSSVNKVMYSTSFKIAKKSLVR